MTRSNPPSLESKPLSSEADGHQQSQQTKFLRKRRWLPIVGIILLLGGVGWWWQSRSTAQNQAQSAQQRPVTARLEPVQTGNVQDYSEFVGNLDALNAVQLKPEVEGRISRILVRSGDRVEAGRSLVEINPDVRQAELAGSQAAVTSARATRNNTLQQLEALEAERATAVAERDLKQAQLDRRRTLVAQGAVAREDADILERDLRAAEADLNARDRRIQAATATVAEAEATIQQAEASATAASDQLQRNTIVAPFAGMVGDMPFKVGDFVQTSDNVTSVVQNDSLELRLSVPSERSTELRIGLRVALLDNQGKPVSDGRISFVEPQVNATAQSILVKAVFNNPQQRLRDNQSLRARIIWRESPGVLVPTSAISRSSGQTFVFVAKPADAAGSNAPTFVAEQRLVKLGSIQGNNYQVLEGLKPGDQIAVTGLLNLTNGAAIQPQTEQPASSPAPVNR
jgi:RND family efflux transporter MFP subunit